MAERIYFSSVLKLAEAITGWFYPRTPPSPLPAVPTLHRVRLEMVRRLLGMHSTQDKTTGQTTCYPPGHAQLLRRLLIAGIDATTSPWRIVNERAARACWYQLREIETFRELEQARLLNNGEELPNINIPWRTSVTGVAEIQETKKRILEQQQSIPQYFMGQVNEHFCREPQPPRKGVGL